MNPVRRPVVAIALCTAVLVPGCGVSSENEPQHIEESTEQQPAATPSFDAETSPAPEPTETSPTPVPTSTR